MDNVDPADLVKIVQQYSGYVSSLCRKYYIQGGTFDDLFEEGVIGILEACKIIMVTVCLIVNLHHLLRFALKDKLLML